jgi:HD-GYP domain-containing protein (c-di-GMP phosphodiesterase class II)
LIQGGFRTSLSDSQIHLRKALEDLKSAHEKAMTEIVRSNDMVFEALGDALDMRAAESEGPVAKSHEESYCTLLLLHKRWESLGKRLRRLRGAFLHDIGNMGVPDTVLRKPGELTSDEVSMRTHPYRGYQLVKKIPFMALPAEIVYSHQERYDGTGYPQGLKGK